jgi:branched-chain amino acid transport system substrate-binding protein
MKRLLLLALVALAPTLASSQEIKVGGIFDLTGITADVGKPFAQGVRDGTAWLNENGGINGKKVKLVDADYGYKIPEANALYKRLTGTEKVVMINGWGTGDTEALKTVVAGDKMPYFSASFSAHLTDPKVTPYNFFVGPSYSDVLRGWLAWVKQDWKDKSRNPRVAFFYGDNAYGKSPIEAGRRYCKENGIDLVAEEILPGTVQDATSQLLDMKQKGADYGFTQVTINNTSAVLRDAKKLGMTNVKWGTNTWGFGENLVAVAKDAAEGVVAAMLNPPFGENVPGMAKVMDFHKKNHPADTHDTNYVRGWSYVMVWAEGLKRADKAGKITGESIKNALETLKDFDLQGLAAPVTYTSTDHRPSTKVTLYQIQGGKIVRLGDYDQGRKAEFFGF